ncbi:hypothetical protein D9M68_684190 [compost metagenome]
MAKYIALFSLLLSLSLSSCDNGNNNQVITKPEPVVIDEIVNSTAVNKKGEKLEMSFNNTKNIAQVEWQGEKIELAQQPTASGIRYTNEHYELMGKGELVNLIKDGKVIFESVKAHIYGEKQLFVAAETKNCSAGVLQKECLQVKYDADEQNWELFYEPIEGFKHENGYEYELLVLDERVDNPAADGSSIRYKLIKEISRKKK